MAPSRPQDSTSTFDAPPYEANWIPDASQDSEALLDRHRRNSMNPAAHDAYRRLLEEKTEKFGVIHVDPATGYRARFKPQGGRGGQGSAGARQAGETGGRSADDASRGAGRGADQPRGASAGTSGAASTTGASGGGAGGADPRDAELAELRRQLAESRGQGGGQA